MEDYRLEQSGQQVQNILSGAAMQVDLNSEVERATEAENILDGKIDAEEERAKVAEKANADDIDAIEEKIPSGASSSNKLATASDVNDEAQARSDADQTINDKIDTIEAKIPTGASSENKLATEEYVDDSVATNTATFRGTYNLVSDLGLLPSATHEQIAYALGGEIATVNNNDYCFVQIPTSSETPTQITKIERYKFNGDAWAFEYDLNNSGFTAAQWSAINSGITNGDVTKLSALPTNAELTTLLNGKQDTLTFDNAPTENSNNPVKSGGVYSGIKAEEERAKAAEKANADDIDAIEEKIPSGASSSNKLATSSDVTGEATTRENADAALQQAIEAILLLIPSAATSLNQLADKAFVNSSIATNTATFRGTFNSVSDLHLSISATHEQIGTMLASSIATADNNDYAFVQIPTSAHRPTEIARTERYKFNGTTWEYEYDLNNSGYTTAQWAAINSTITQELVTKLSALPNNDDLTTALSVLTDSISAINAKIPSAASSDNKLVDTTAMQTYIAQLLDVLDANYNVTSTDGHVTVQITQTNGKVTDFAVTTSDIASAADLELIAGRVTTAEGNISTNAEDIAQLQAAYAALTQNDLVIIQPTDTWPVANPAENIIYRVVDRVNTPPEYYSDYMWNDTTMVLMAQYNNAIDPRPKKGSTNLVESGGVFNNMGALDVSELNATENPHTLATYADLSAALAAIPSDYRKGGMSIKFVQSSDNKYVQFRYMSSSTAVADFINVANWQGVDDVPTVESDNLVKSGGVAKAINNSMLEINGKISIIKGVYCNTEVGQVATFITNTSRNQTPFIKKVGETSNNSFTIKGATPSIFVWTDANNVVVLRENASLRKAWNNNATYLTIGFNNSDNPDGYDNLEVSFDRNLENQFNEKIDTLKESDDLLDKKIGGYTFEWELGSIDSSTGTDTPSTTRQRTVGYTLLKDVTELQSEDDISYILFYKWNSNISDYMFTHTVDATKGVIDLNSIKDVDDVAFRIVYKLTSTPQIFAYGLKTDISLLSTDIDKLKQNVGSDISFVVGGIDTSNGSYDSSITTRQCCIDFIDVTYIKSITTYDNKSYISFYKADIQGGYLGKYDINSAGETQMSTLLASYPAAKFIRITYKATTKPQIYLSGAIGHLAKSISYLKERIAANAYSLDWYFGINFITSNHQWEPRPIFEAWASGFLDLSNKVLKISSFNKSQARFVVFYNENFEYISYEEIVNVGFYEAASSVFATAKYARIGTANFSTIGDIVIDNGTTALTNNYEEICKQYYAKPCIDWMKRGYYGIGSWLASKQLTDRLNTHFVDDNTINILGFPGCGGRSVILGNYLYNERYGNDSDDESAEAKALFLTKIDKSTGAIIVKKVYGAEAGSSSVTIDGTEYSHFKYSMMFKKGNGLGLLMTVVYDYVSESSYKCFIAYADVAPDTLELSNIQKATLDGVVAEGQTDVFDVWATLGIGISEDNGKYYTSCNFKIWESTDCVAWTSIPNITTKLFYENPSYYFKEVAVDCSNNIMHIAVRSYFVEGTSGPAGYVYIFKIDMTKWKIIDTVRIRSGNTMPSFFNHNGVLYMICGGPECEPTLPESDERVYNTATRMNYQLVQINKVILDESYIIAQAMNVNFGPNTICCSDGDYVYTGVRGDRFLMSKFEIPHITGSDVNEIMSSLLT